MRSIILSLAVVVVCTLIIVVAQLTAPARPVNAAPEITPVQDLVAPPTPMESPMTTAPANDDYTTTESGLKYKDFVVGTGVEPRKGQTVVVDYTGTLTNGRKFDSSRDRGQPFEFKIGVGQVIKGWDEGVGTMRVGGRRELVIPADLAYGSRSVGGVIPANSVLVFDVELLGVK